MITHVCLPMHVLLGRVRVRLQVPSVCIFFLMKNHRSPSSAGRRLESDGPRRRTRAQEKSMRGGDTTTCPNRATIPIIRPYAWGLWGAQQSFFCTSRDLSSVDWYYHLDQFRTCSGCSSATPSYFRDDRSPPGGRAARTRSRKKTMDGLAIRASVSCGVPVSRLSSRPTAAAAS